MDLVLSAVALASFLAMILAWAVVPQAGPGLPATESAPEVGAAHALGVN
ncbi:MAG: hypothetical protein JO057_26265 [Chloroflexi bacterium]|nr:hypothetical protein [Chloroflexota bacterium]